MSVPYDAFTKDFLRKITEYDLVKLETREEEVDDYMRAAIVPFKNICKYDLVTTRDDENRVFNVDINKSDLYDIIDIVSDGMVAQWLKPYWMSQDLLENSLNTRDFSGYSPAELLMRVGDAYKKVSKSYKNRIYNYSYDTGDIKGLHL